MTSWEFNKHTSERIRALAVRFMKLVNFVSLFLYVFVHHFIILLSRESDGGASTYSIWQIRIRLKFVKFQIFTFCQTNHLQKALKALIYNGPKLSILFHPVSKTLYRK